MKSIILCEGSTDSILLQYFMRKVYGWQDNKSNERANSKFLKQIRTLTKENNKLSIAGCGCSGRILPGLSYILEYNSLSSESEAYDKIVILTDRDEVITETEFAQEIEKVLHQKNMEFNDNPVNNHWIECTYKNGHGKNCKFSLLMLVIPFEETGAMETFLLNVISENDEYDAEIIRKCNSFVDNVDSEKRYLSKRRNITKAKFDVYFSVRTAAEQFAERQNILKNVEWEKYAALQADFRKLGELSN